SLESLWGRHLESWLKLSLVSLESASLVFGIVVEVTVGVVGVFGLVCVLRLFSVWILPFRC
ncbi:6502_t:CDS:2, partial [Gigaspora rosea]